MIREKTVIFRNSLGQNLSGVVHFPNRETTPPLLIMAHGFTDDKVSDNRLFIRFARRAREQGFAVLRFDFAGSGESEGEFADITITREINDLGSAIAFAQTIPCLEESPVYLIGYSLGATVALSVAAKNEIVRGVVGWAPVSDLTAVFRSILGDQAFQAARTQSEIPCKNDLKYFHLKSSFFQDLIKHSPRQDIAKLSPRPVLLMQGTADMKVLPEQTRELFSSANEPKALHVINDATHSFALREDELFEITLSHLDTWNREAWYAGDRCPINMPTGNFPMSGQA